MKNKDLVERENRSMRSFFENRKFLNPFIYQYDILDSRINMTRLVPQLRVLHKSQPA